MGNFRGNGGFSEPAPRAVRPGALSRLADVVDSTGELRELTDALSRQDEAIEQRINGESLRIDQATAGAGAAQIDAADAVRRADAADAAVAKLSGRVAQLENQVREGLRTLAKQLEEQGKTLTRHDQRLTRLERGGGPVVKAAPRAPRKTV